MINGKTVAIDARMIEMSGIGTYIQHLMNEGIYDVAIGDKETIRKFDPYVNVIQYTSEIYGLKGQFAFPIKQLKRCKVDIVHFPHYNVPLTYKGKYVVTVHDLTHIVLPEAMNNLFKTFYAKLLLKNAICNAQHVFTVSNNSKQDILSYFPIDDSHISITYDAVDGDFRVVQQNEIEYLYDKFSIPKNKKLLLYVGNQKAHKNLNRLLEALSQIKDENILLLLVGKAFDDTNLRYVEKKMGIQQRVIHTGSVNKKELIDLYNLADLFVFPSLYEGFGIPPLEAMACGTAVVSSNASSLPEVVGDAAVLFNPKDVDDIKRCIISVLYDQKLQSTLIAKGSKQYKKFNWESTIKEVKEEITKVLNNEK